MYQVFNMGHRLEIFTDAETAKLMITEAANLSIEAKVIGRVETSNKKELHLMVNGEEIVY